MSPQYSPPKYIFYYDWIAFILNFLSQIFKQTLFGISRSNDIDFIRVLIYLSLIAFLNKSLQLQNISDELPKRTQCA